LARGRAAFLERSAAVTPEPARRAERNMARAQAKAPEGAVDAAWGLLPQRKRDRSMISTGGQ